MRDFDPTIKHLRAEVENQKQGQRVTIAAAQRAIGIRTAERDSLARVIEKVRALHQPTPEGEYSAIYCGLDRLTYPCPTIRALKDCDE